MQGSNTSQRTEIDHFGLSIERSVKKVPNGSIQGLVPGEIDPEIFRFG